MKNALFLLIVIVFSLRTATASSDNYAGISSENYFIENKGQWPAEVLWLHRAPGADIWITRSGAVWDYPKIEISSNPASGSVAIEIRCGGNMNYALNIYTPTGIGLQNHRWRSDSAAEKSIEFDMSNYQSGVYYIVLNAGESIFTKKLVIIK
ncbi:MAG: T9SS type A sorting domain-containing protein [Candidatus Kapaibacterium sp.]